MLSVVSTDGLYFLSTENVLKTVISIYMEGLSLPFPTLEEVVVCTTETTDEEVSELIVCVKEFALLGCAALSVSVIKQGV